MYSKMIPCSCGFRLDILIYRRVYTRQSMTYLIRVSVLSILSHFILHVHVADTRLFLSGTIAVLLLNYFLKQRFLLSK
jgi:hypothetical protein